MRPCVDLHYSGKENTRARDMNIMKQSYARSKPNFSRPHALDTSRRYLPRDLLKDAKKCQNGIEIVLVEYFEEEINIDNFKSRDPRSRGARYRDIYLSERRMPAIRANGVAAIPPPPPKKASKDGLSSTALSPPRSPQHFEKTVIELRQDLFEARCALDRLQLSQKKHGSLSNMSSTGRTKVNGSSCNSIRRSDSSTSRSRASSGTSRSLYMKLRARYETRSRHKQPPPIFANSSLSVKHSNISTAAGTGANDVASENEDLYSTISGGGTKSRSRSSRQHSTDHGSQNSDLDAVHRRTSFSSFSAESEPHRRESTTRRKASTGKAASIAATTTTKGGRVPRRPPPPRRFIATRHTKHTI